MGGPLLSPQQAQPTQPWEGEEGPALSYRLEDTVPNERLFGSTLPILGYPTSLGSVPWEEGKAAQNWDIENASPLEAICMGLG